MNRHAPFAGLAPRASHAGRRELRAFDVEEALQLGQELRRGISAALDSRESIARRLLEGLEAFEHDDRPAWVLVRVFVTAQGTSGHDVLRLLATRGLEEAWNDVGSSVGHRELPLGGNASPMIAELTRQLRIGDGSAPAASTFFVAEAKDSPFVPAKEFVRAYDVRSVVGFGTTAWPGATFVMIGFARAPLDRRIAASLELVALYTKLALLASAEAHTHFDPRALAERTSAALEELVTAQEVLLRERTREARRELEAARVGARDGGAREVAERQKQNESLRRTQRAMLNVVEDLRDARTALETKVAERTRELAIANETLVARNRDLEEFVYIASHDLQEPLRTISGYLQMIERRYGDKLGTEGDEFIRFAIDGAQRMQALLASLLLYSRVATKDRHVERVPLDVPLDAALQNLALRVEETKATITRSPLPELDAADPTQMTQLFQNLIANALKFAGDKPPSVWISGERAEDHVTLTIRDAGIGFNPKFADRIFKLFRRLRRDTPGTGIGLSVCKKIAERHGGTITATAEPGKGATFTISLPIGQAPRTAP